MPACRMFAVLLIVFSFAASGSLAADPSTVRPATFEKAPGRLSGATSNNSVKVGHGASVTCAGMRWMVAPVNAPKSHACGRNSRFCRSGKESSPAAG